MARKRWKQCRPGGRRTARVAIVVLLGLALVAGCGSGEEQTGNAPSADTVAVERGGQLVVGVPQREPEAILRLALESLTAFADDGSVVPYLAESVEPNDTFDRWTIRVRPGITFHNGEALDAAAVKANLDTYSVSELYATDPFAPIVATTVVDDMTVEVELDQPWASFPAHLTAEQSDGTGLIVAPATIEAMGALFLADPGADGLFGTGPFIIEGSDAGGEVWHARRNPDYWQDGLPYVDEVEVRAVPDGTSRLADVESGDLDIAVVSDVPDGTPDDQVVEQQGDVQVLGVALNMQAAPLDDPRIREAVALATDVEALAATAGVDPAMVATGPFGPGSSWGDPSAAPVPHDPERAAELVAEYEAENGPVAIRLGTADLQLANVAVQQELAAQWSAAGIEVELSVVDPFTQTATLLVLADFDAVLGRMFGMPDPDLYYFWWHSSALRTEEKGVGYNFVGVDDPELDEALDAARATLDVDDRREAMVTVQERLADAQPYVWLWGVRWAAVTSPRVHGLDEAPTPDGGTRLAMIGPRLNLEAVWIER